MYWIIVAFALALVGCGTAQNIGQPTAQIATASDQTIDEVQLESYDGPRARVAVYRFGDQSAKGKGGHETTTGWYSPAIGNGMADMLNDALMQSNRFIVLDRQTLQDVLMEQDLGTSGRMKPHTAPAIGLIEGAELLIKGAVTEFEPGSTGAQSGGVLSYLGLPGAVTAGVLGSVQQSHVAMVIQVVDAKTSRLLFSSTVEGQANDFNLAGLVGGLGGSSGLGVWQKTPMEKAIRIAIANGVQELAKRTPPSYYHYRDQSVSTSGSTVSVKPAVASANSQASLKPATAALPSAVVVKSKLANLRDAPNVKQGKIVTTLKEGVKLIVNGEEKDWYNIQTENGEKGWISKSLTK